MPRTPLLVETGFRLNKQEMAQIVNVAINRASKYHITLAEVVNPDRRAFPAWNPGPNYREWLFDSSTGWVGHADFRTRGPGVGARIPPITLRPIILSERRIPTQSGDFLVMIIGHSFDRLRPTPAGGASENQCNLFFMI